MFRSCTPPEAIELVTKLLVYNPERRLKPLDALCHPYFDELREPNAKLPNGNAMPNLFEFTKEEISTTSPQVLEELIPDWLKLQIKEAEVRESSAA